MDEPPSNLDARLREEVRVQIKESDEFGRRDRAVCDARSSGSGSTFSIPWSGVRMDSNRDQMRGNAA